MLNFPIIRVLHKNSKFQMVCSKWQMNNSELQMEFSEFQIEISDIQLVNSEYYLTKSEINKMETLNYDWRNQKIKTFHSKFSSHNLKLRTHKKCCFWITNETFCIPKCQLMSSEFKIENSIWNLDILCRNIIYINWRK